MPTLDPKSFFSDLLTILQLEPTPWRLGFFAEWARWEGTGAEWNPLATTQWGGEDPDDPYWNTFGDANQYHVRNYSSKAAGLAATAITLQNGYYPAILDSLRLQTIAPGASANIRTWGTIGFATAIDDGWSPPAAPQPADLDALWDIVRASGLDEWAKGGFAPILSVIQDLQRRENTTLSRLDALESRPGRA